MLGSVRTDFANLPAAQSVRAGGFVRPEEVASTPALPKLLYSPVKIAYDPEVRRVFMQFRDGETGEVRREVPPRMAVKLYEKSFENEEGRGVLGRGRAVDTTDQAIQPKIVKAPSEDDVKAAEGGSGELSGATGNDRIADEYA